MANASPAITNCTIKNNNYYGIRVVGTSEPTITGCTISGHSKYPIYADINYISKIEANTFSDNGHDYTGITTSALSGNVILKKAATPHVFLNALTVPEGVTLTVEPGVTVKFDDASFYLAVSGSLVADATSDESIVFTSNKAEPAAAQWGGIRFKEGSSGVLNYCVVEYGGYSNYQAGISTANASPTITNCTIKNNNYYGIRVVGTSEPTITGCTISGHSMGINSSSSMNFITKNCIFYRNTSYAVNNSKSSTSIVAKNCNWGHISGPLDSSDDRSSGGLYNPSGQGQKVSDHVDYYPWKNTTVGATATPSGLTATPGNKTINLTWNANAESDLGGYRLYYGTSPGLYGNSLLLSKVTAYQLTELTNDMPYYITISSINTIGAESEKAPQITETPMDDQEAPTSIISDPTSGDEISGQTYTIRGTADDGTGTGVKKVEVSSDDGTTWKVATGTTNWYHIWDLPDPGAYTIKSRATDDAGNIEAPGDGVTVQVVAENKPTATTNAATAVTTTSATLNGTVNPNGYSTNVVFEWGIDTVYGHEINAFQSPLTGTTDQGVSASITDLAPETTYHYRVKAVNTYGTAYGEDQQFDTPIDSTQIFYVSFSDDTCGNNSPCYSSIQKAIDAASQKTVIKISEGAYDETPILNQSKHVTLKGGWDPDYTKQTPNKTFIKSPKATQGSLTLQMLSIKP